MIESWDSGFCERVGVCAGLFFFCERGVRERDAREACAACRRGFVGGWLLGCRESAKSVFQKSELASLKQRTFEKQRRFPPAKNQHLSCRVRRQAAHASRSGFSRRQGRGVTPPADLCVLRWWRIRSVFWCGRTAGVR